MNTAYNNTNTTTVQDARNRYNALLTQALANINRRKTDKTAQPEEVTTATPEEVTTTTEPTATTPTQQPEEVTTQQPEEVTTEEVTAPADTEEEEKRKRREADCITVLKYCVEHYGEVGADYLDTLDYSKLDEQAPRTVMFGRAKVTERRYTLPEPNQYGYLSTHGLARYHNRNGKRAEFVVYQYGEAIELRAYGRNNNTYNAEVRFDGGTLTYNVTDGLVTRAELTRDNKTISVEFDDTNRPETPRDLPAPAPSKPTSKETTKEAHATTEEVQKVTTSEQEDGAAPYWLLLDNELKAQQEEQEQALATPEKSEEEPMNAPQMLKKMIEEHKKRIKDGTATKSIYNANALETEVLTPKRAKELLGDDYSDYNTYILVEGTHIVETGRPTLKKTLYIDDESPEYKEYQRGNISAVELYRDDMLSMYGSKGKIKAVEDNPATLTVDETKDKVLSFNLYRRAGYGYRKANPDEVEIYKAAMRASHEAFTKRLDSYIKRYGSKIYVHSYWANR